jgi:amino acid adenylation domain-containing protein
LTESAAVDYIAANAGKHESISSWLGDHVMGTAGHDPDRELGYWRERLAGLEPLELPAAERQQILSGWSGMASPFAAGTVHELVEHAVARAPEATSVTCGDQQLSYAELNRRANQLARSLIGHGAGAETLVAVCMDRGVEMVVALLGVLKSGAAYLPLDPGYPAERIAFMLADTSPRLLIATRAAAQSLPGLDVPVLVLDDPTTVSVLDRLDGSDPAPRSGPGNLAYVMYTSGSTGTPKGTMIQHQSVCRLVDGNWFTNLTAGDVVGLGSNFCFDALTFECWGALSSGATLAVLEKETLLSAAELKAAIARLGISVLWLTSGLFNRLLQACPDLLDGLEQVLYGGEAIDRSVADALLRRPHAPRLVTHCYGPTETTTFATCYQVGPDHAGLATMPIGRPIANTEVLVLDRLGEPAPVGVPGELLIGGPGVARGYWQRPALTAERFVPHPFSADPAARVYRTGDLVRWLPDGVLEFVGRIDNQVKLRGLRIEPGEIEAVLDGHPGVAAAVVVAREDTPGDKRLVAYCAPAGEGELEVAALQDWCRRSLPDYMVPGWFVVLSELPLTPNGKIDRKGLPAPDGNRPALRQPYTAPRSEVEESIAQVWAEVLGVDRVGVHDQFFDLGDSLLAAQLASRLAATLTTRVAIRDVFRNPTVASLAAAVSARAADDDAGVIPRRDRSAAAGLSFAQQQLWVADQLAPSAAEYVIPYALRMRGRLDVAALEAAFSGVVERHEALRTRFDLSAECGLVQVIDADAALPIGVTDLRGVEERERLAAELAERDAELGFDLAADRLIRVSVVRLAEDEHLMLVAMHHIVADGWSIDVLTRELRALYAAALSGEPAQLPELPVQYADYAAWQRQWLSGDVLAEQLGYWRERLAGLEPLELPADRPRPADRSGAGGSVRFVVPAEVAGRVGEVAAGQGASLFMALLAGFAVVLARWSGQGDVAVGVPVAGRGRAEVEGLIGCFVNTLVLRTDVSGDPSFAELVGRVRDGALGAFAHQDVPFERLVEELAPRRDLSRNPLYQVGFAFQNFLQGRWELPGVLVEREPVAVTTSKFDVSVHLTEQAGGSLAGELTYASDLFDRATASRLAGHFQYLLGQVSPASATEPVSRLAVGAGSTLA